MICVCVERSGIICFDLVDVWSVFTLVFVRTSVFAFLVIVLEVAFASGLRFVVLICFCVCVVFWFCVFVAFVFLCF